MIKNLGFPGWTLAIKSSYSVEKLDHNNLLRPSLIKGNMITKIGPNGNSFTSRLLDLKFLKEKPHIVEVMDYFIENFRSCFTVLHNRPYYSVKDLLDFVGDIPTPKTTREKLDFLFKVKPLRKISSFVDGLGK